MQHFRLDFPFNITDQKLIMCRTFAILRNTCRCISPWILTFFTLERFLIFCYPQQFQMLTKPLIAKRIVLAVIVMSVLISVYHPLLMGVFTVPAFGGQRKQQQQQSSSYQFNSIFSMSRTTTRAITVKNADVAHVFNILVKSEPRDIQYLQNLLTSTRKTCDVLSEYRSIYLYITFVYTIICILIPILIVIIFNTLLILRLYKSNDKWKNAKLILEEQGISFKEIKEKRLQIENLKITWMLVIVSLSFILLTLPHVIVYFTLNVSHLRKKMYPNSTPLINLNRMQSIEKITELFYISNYGINFFLYILTRNKFREVLIEKLKCKTLFGTYKRNNNKRRLIRFA